MVSADPHIADPAPPPIPADPGGSGVGDGGPHLEPGRRRSGSDEHPGRLGLLDDDAPLARDRLDDDVNVGLVDDKTLAERRSRNGADEQRRQEREENKDLSPRLGAADCVRYVKMFHDPPETDGRARFIQQG
jgi:hypothetical protein